MTKEPHVQVRGDLKQLFAKAKHGNRGGLSNKMGTELKLWKLRERD